MRALLPILSLALLAARCSSPAPEPGPSDADVVDGGGTAADCSAMCATILRLDCAAAWGIDPNDGACLEFCREVELRGNTTLCPALVAKASSCEEADRLSQQECTP